MRKKKTKNESLDDDISGIDRWGEMKGCRTPGSG
jgi:hypothetical protein